MTFSLAQRYGGLAVAVLLLAGLATVPQLNMDALSGDELRTVIAAGGAHYGPRSFPAGILGFLYDVSPDQALGFTLVARLWGDAVGWHEFSLRVFSYLMGTLALAMVYRTGRDLFHPLAGLSAALILATSIVFITYMHKFRVFPAAALSVAGALWCYWRVALHPRPPGIGAQVGLVAAGVGLLYTHYFSSPFLVALGVYHLLFAPKTRRWWRPVLLFIPVLILFSPAVYFLWAGFVKSVDTTPFGADALTPLGVIDRMVYYFGNGGYWLSVPLLLWAGVLVVRPPQASTTDRARNLRLLGVTALVMLAVILVMNELTGVLLERRIRYLMGLWVLVALLAGVGVWRLRALHLLVPVVVLAVWAAVGLLAIRQNTLLISDYGDSAPVPAWRELMQPVRAQGVPDDAFVYLGRDEQQALHYTHAAPNLALVPPWHGEPELRAATENRARVWLAAGRFNSQQNTELAQDLLTENGLQTCAEYIDDQDFHLRLYAASAVLCPGGEPLLTFGEHMTLMGQEGIQTDGAFTLYTGWQLSDALPVGTYSVGFHLYPADGEALVTQQDIGLGAFRGMYLPLYVTFPLDDLPGGNYEVQVVVYAWQSGQRLTGQNVQTGTSGDSLPLAQFRVGGG